MMNSLVNPVILLLFKVLILEAYFIQNFGRREVPLYNSRMDIGECSRRERRKEIFSRFHERLLLRNGIEEYILGREQAHHLQPCKVIQKFVFWKFILN